MATATDYLTLDAKGRATLPERVRHDLGVGAGDHVLLERTARGTYELVPATLVATDQLWFHHPTMRRRVAEAEADVAAGRTTHTATADEAQAHLDSLKARPGSRRRPAAP